MDKFENILNNILGPIANKMNNNKFFSALANAFIRTTPITLGAAFIMLIGNFPIPAWTTWLASVGLSSHFTAVVGATLNVLALFVAFNIAYCYAESVGDKPLTPGLLSATSFLILAPQTIQVPQLEKAVTKFPGQANVTGISNIEAFQTTQLGGPGLIVAIILGFSVAVLYHALKKRNFVIKLPDSVPPNVSESLAPTFIAGIIYGLALIVRIGMSYTPFDNVFNLIYGLMQAPLQGLTASPISIIVIYTLANLFWFFGIHPSVVYSVVTPVLMANFYENINAYNSGQPVPYLTMAIVYIFTSNAFGGQGATYGLIFSMARAKSARYKQLFKLAFAPSLFNINEPLVFGTPIMLNPIFFVPMIVGPAMQGGIAYLLASVLGITSYNAPVQLPWTTPTPISAFLVGGWQFLVIAIVVMLSVVGLWYPFFKVADNRELAAEKAFETVTEEDSDHDITATA